MVKNYLLITLRNLLRNQTYTLVNLLGLAVGISASLMMVVHIRQELSYEKNFPKHERISRVSFQQWAKSSLPLAAELEKAFPAIEQTARFGQRGTFDVAMYGDRHIPVGNGYFADQAVISMFDLTLLSGSPDETLTRPHTIVLTGRVAQQLFGDESPIGKSIEFGGMDALEVTGVVEDLPPNTHFSFEYLISMPTQFTWLSDDSQESRGWMSVYTYVLFRDQGAMQDASERMKEFSYQFYQVLGNREEVERRQSFYELHPIASIHLDGNREQEMGKNSEMVYVYIFAALALLTILVASVNFINLFSTQVIKRSKEIGVRKVNGAGRSHIFWQFLSEGFIITGLSTVLALLLCFIMLPFYNSLTELFIRPADLFHVNNLLLLGSIVIMIVLLSSGAPSFAISGFSVLKAIKGNQLPSSWLLKARRKLVVFQFVISILILISTLVISQQMEYLQSKDVGFNQEQLISVRLYGPLWEEAVEHREVFSNELSRIPGVVSTANTSGVLGNGLSVEGLQVLDSTREEDAPSMRCIRADEDLVPTLGLELVAGTNFQPTADTSLLFILNEKAIEVLNLHNPIGKLAENTADSAQGEIVGVVKNFNFASLHYEVEPLFIEYRPTGVGTLLIRTESANSQKTVAQIEDKISTLLPGTQVLYSFMDNDLREMYVAENTMRKMLLMFSGLAIVIACLGLFGITSYTVVQRAKEIGIRKVLGASLSSILLLLTKDYIKLIALAFVVAVPVANYLLQEWLQSFAYQISVQWWMYAIPGIAILLTALLIVSGRTYQAAMRNPVDSLRDE